MLFHNRSNTGWFECVDGSVVTSAGAKHYYITSLQSAVIEHVHSIRAYCTSFSIENTKAMTKAHELPCFQHKQTILLFLYSLSGAGSGGKHQTVTIPSGCIWGCSADEPISQQWTLYGYSF